MINSVEHAEKISEMTKGYLMGLTTYKEYRNMLNGELARFDREVNTRIRNINQAFKSTKDDYEASLAEANQYKAD